jgi:hypothetical protein
VQSEREDLACIAAIARAGAKLATDVRSRRVDSARHASAQRAAQEVATFPELLGQHGGRSELGRPVSGIIWKSHQALTYVTRHSLHIVDAAVGPAIEVSKAGAAHTAGTTRPTIFVGDRFWLHGGLEPIDLDGREQVAPPSARVLAGSRAGWQSRPDSPVLPELPSLRASRRLAFEPGRSRRLAAPAYSRLKPFVAAGWQQPPTSADDHIAATGPPRSRHPKR